MLRVYRVYIQYHIIYRTQNRYSFICLTLQKDIINIIIVRVILVVIILSGKRTFANTLGKPNNREAYILQT